MTARRNRKPSPRPRPEPLTCPGCRRSLGPYATEEEAATYLRRAPETLRHMRVRGDGPPYQQVEARGTVTYAYVDLDAWMRSHTRYSTSDVTEGRAATAAH